MTLKVVYDINVAVLAVLKPGSIPASLLALAMEPSREAVSVACDPGGIYGSSKASEIRV
jgi:hypothetical protein